MRRNSLIAILVFLLVFLFLLSVLSNILAGYPEPPRSPETEKERTGKDTEEEPSVLLFKVSPATPRLYWSTSTADYYTGSKWLRTTEEKLLEEFPPFQDTNATKIFTVEIATSQREFLLPIASPNSTLANMSLASFEDLRFYKDTVGNVHKVVGLDQARAPLVYKVSWRDVEVDDWLISPDNIPGEILDKYLQLPDIPLEVSKLAEDLENPSYSILDQVLADVQHLRTNFVYDVENSKYLYERITQGSDVSSFLERRKGVCLDAATALAVILRIQKIPARISIGYKPSRPEKGKLLYYTTGAHAVTEVYLAPYGWIQFDATPPLEENPLVKVSSFKKECSPGSELFYQLSITNRRNVTDNFKLFVKSKQKWNVEAAPEEIRIGALQTADALLEVAIPDDANLGEKDVVTVTVASLSHPEVAFSILAITQVENILCISTTTMLENIDDAIIRGEAFWANGTVLSANDELVDNMTIFVFLTKSREAEGLIVGKAHSRQGIFQIKSTLPYLMDIGDYKVVAVSLGTTQYTPSSSDCIIKLCATTRIELCCEEEFLIGYGAIHGCLLWDNGTGFAEAPISFTITSLATPSEVWKSQNSTFKDGTFRTETTFENPGLYEVRAVFPGNDYVSGSNATCVVELKRGVPAIQIFGENIAVRGEVFNITVTIQYEHIRVWGEPVAVTFDNQLLATIETRDDGSYTWSFLVDSDETLGSHFFAAALENGNVSAVHEVAVKSKTRLTTKVTDVAGGIFLLYSASLSDDHDLPIPGAEIAVDNYGLSWKTDNDGNLTFLLDTVKLWPENLTLTTRFEGSKLYLPVSTDKEVVLDPVTSLPFLIPLISPTLVIMILVYAKHQIGRTQIFRQTSAAKVVEERAVVEEEPIHMPQKKQPLRIILPDIEAQFSNVWGVNDNLRIEIALDNSVLGKTQKREVQVFIDEETVTSVRLSQQGRAVLSHAFTEKGQHKIGARLQRESRRQSCNAEIELRVVDYAEEIISLYNEFLRKLANTGTQAREVMTAREIEHLILRKSDLSPQALSKATACFEKAEYSNHLTTRKDYKTMYLSLKELNM